MKLFTKKNSEYNKTERYFTSFYSFITFGLIGIFVRLFSNSVNLSTMSEIFMQFAPYFLGFGGIAAVLAYFLPKPFNILLAFLPTPGAN